MPEVISYRFDTEIASHQEPDNISSAETREQRKSPDAANETKNNEDVKGELKSEANDSRTALRFKPKL